MPVQYVAFVYRCCQSKKASFQDRVFELTNTKLAVVTEAFHTHVVMIFIRWALLNPIS